MTSKLLLLTTLLFLIAPLASATDTLITVKTLPYHEVQLTTFDSNSESFSAFESFRDESDMYGDISFTFSSNEPTFNIIVYIKFNNENIVSKKFDDEFSAGEPIYLEVAPKGARLLETPEKEPIEKIEITAPLNGISYNIFENSVKIEVQNAGGEEITIKSANLNIDAPEEAKCNTVTNTYSINTEETKTLTFSGCTGLTAGEAMNAGITITYTKLNSETEETSTGTLSGKISETPVEESSPSDVQQQEQKTTASDSTSAGITGLSVSSNVLKKSGIIYIIIIALIAAVVLFIFRARKRAANISGFGGFKASKFKAPQMSEIQITKNALLTNESKMIQELERKVGEAQKELRILKNQGKIKEAEQRLIKDRDELEKLRSGDF